MASVSVYNMEGKEIDKMELNESVFAAPVNEHLVHRAVVLQLANKRQGTQSAKTRAEVRGGGRKPWRQKGTGHARQGSIRSPQWKGGGVVFAPKPRNYSFKMNRKEKQAAIKSALSQKCNENKFYVLDSLSFEEPKTKKMKEVLNNLNIEKALVITEQDAANVAASAKNLVKVRSVYTNAINVYDILKYDTIVITKDAVGQIEEVYA
ncbi:MAG: 50S ribosomal protein L4 [Lachnoclostridium sp.]|jgi:large subunit ribosomal protein L4|nr:50S ribosomal protein L4 [Lachnoclostridium sp.]